jgi:hypothetical protein
LSVTIRRPKFAGGWPIVIGLALLPMMAGAGAHAESMDMGASGSLGPYSMMRDASGTSWQPDAAPMLGIQGQHGVWSTMLHGNLYIIADRQGGPRGAQYTFSESMLMAAAQRAAGRGRLSVRAMLSLDPLMGKHGYPKPLMVPHR